MIAKLLQLSLAALLLAGCGSDNSPPPATDTSPSAGDAPGKALAMHHAMSSANMRPIFESRFLGFNILEHPADMWIIQEMITEIRPDFIIEAGTLAGGSALFYASILKEVNDQGKIITIDIEPRVDAALRNLEKQPELHRRVTEIFARYIEVVTSNSVDPALIAELTERVAGKTVMVMLDSCHNYGHVMKELELYSPLVSVGSYIIVQDTIIDAGIAQGSAFMAEASECPGYTVTGGPGKAAAEFLAGNDGFAADPSRERFGVTMFPSGYLQRLR